MQRAQAVVEAEIAQRVAAVRDFAGEQVVGAVGDGVYAKFAAMKEGATQYRHAARDGRGKESGEDGVARFAAAEAHGKRVRLWMLRR